MGLLFLLMGVSTYIPTQSDFDIVNTGMTVTKKH
jgi:hypothetical protein